MKIKTWEKIYWALAIVFIALTIIGFHNNPDPNAFLFNGKPMTNVQFYSFLLPFWGVIFSVIWLIVRYFVNRDEKD